MTALLRTDELARVVRLEEFQALARDRMSPGAFDYVSSGSWDEITLAENEAAWRRRRFRPRVLVDVSDVRPATTFLGQPASMPVAIAPMAIHTLAHPDAELATVRAASAAGIPFTLSTMSSRSIEEVADAAPDATRWFQLYVQSDRGVTRSLVERAAATGSTAIVLTADLPILGYRERDRRSGFQIPSLGNFQEAPPTHVGRERHGFQRLENPRLSALTWDDLATIRSWSSLPLLIKGIMTGEDARLAVEHGADAIVVSNHGARQLDRSPASVDVLAEVIEVLDGAVEVLVDGGVRRGLDIAIAVAMGARGVLVGKPILWALATGGQAGVERALAILDEEFRIALALLGAPTPFELGPSHLLDAGATRG